MPSNAEKAFIEVGYTNWKKASEKSRGFQKHLLSQCHKRSVEAYNSWLKKTPIDALLSEQRRAELTRRQALVKRNRHVVGQLFEIVCLLAKLNLPFRGHDDSDLSKNRGVFRELVEFFGRFNDTMRDHLLNAPSNCTYLGHRTQNEMIVVVGEQIVKAIITAIKAAKFFSITVDETTDMACHEQVSIVVRYVSLCGDIEERLLGLFTVSDTAANNLTKEILALLEIRGLHIADMVGQAYDGAANMSGTYSGVQARIKGLNPTRVLYVHCYSHALNLVIVNTCSTNRVARNFFGVLESLYVFIQASSKRHDVFEQYQKKLYPDQPIVTIKRLSDTRWSCRSDSVRVVKQTLGAIIATLEEIGDSSGDRRAAETNAILKSLDFEFILALEVFADLLSLSKILSDYLQKSNIDIIVAMEMVSSVKSILCDRRSEEEFSKIWTASQTEAHKLGIDPTPPRRRSRQVSRRIDATSTPQATFQSKEEEYRITFFFCVIDLMVSSMDDRFGQQANEVLSKFGYLHPNKMSDQAATKAICEVAQIYSDHINPLIVTREFEILRKIPFLSNCQDINSLLKELYHQNVATAYPNIVKLLQICSTLPFTSASCERTFSKLGLIKSKLRTTMGQDRLFSLMLASMESDITDNLSSDTLVDAFSQQRGRRMDLRLC